MPGLHYRNVVLGGGAMGLAATYHLARRGEPVLLVEQFALGHDRGSSHGAARIIRHSYADERYARLMPRAFDAWRELEAEAGRPLYIRTGGLSLSPPGVDYVARVAASLEAIGCPHRRMSGEELSRTNPSFIVPDDLDVVFEPDAGLILADRALAVQIELARSVGGMRTHIWENSAVLRIDLNADRPTLVFRDRTVTAERLIVAAGPWIGRHFPEYAARLRPERQQILYFLPSNPTPFSIGHLPVFIYKGPGPRDAYYGMPDVSEGGVKVARHGGDPVDPDADDRGIGVMYRDEIRDFLSGVLPDLTHARIMRTEICKYTVADNEDFLVDFHPVRRDVLLASPCSGHGFKFSCLIGRVLADLATIGRTDINIEGWRLK
ncbi:MAG: soxA [Planctomycetota bacterium]|nr:soxA [Planctomycetota bacterium]